MHRYKQIGVRMKMRRKELDLSLSELSILTGISKSSLQRYESVGISNFPVSQIEILANGLKISPLTLMGWDNTLTATTASLSTYLDVSKLTPEQVTSINAEMGSFFKFLCTKYAVPNTHF